MDRPEGGLAATGQEDLTMEFNVAQLMKEATGARREFVLDDDIADPG